MSLRHPQAALRALARRAREAWSSAPVRPAAGGAVAARIFGALEAPAQAGAAPPPCRLPACVHLPAALAAAREGPPAAAALADAFAVFTPALAWFRRPGAEPGPDRFFDGHANAQLVGPRGFARRDDVVAGVSLLAPGVRYPDHWHPPEEIYLVLSPGEWRQRDGPWHAPGPGGVVHNPPGVAHAMRAGDSPLLALWFLWLA